MFELFGGLAADQLATTFVIRDIRKNHPDTGDHQVIESAVNVFDGGLVWFAVKVVCWSGVEDDDTAHNAS